MALPTIVGTIVRLMASHTKAHIQPFDLSSHHHVFYLAVTEGTNFIRLLYAHPRITEDKSLQMFLVGEMNEIRYVMHLLPRRGYTFFPVLGELFDPWFIRSNHRVTAHALA